MIHLAGYYQSVNSAGVLTQLNAIPDVTIFTSGANLRVPSGLTNLLAVGALSAQTGPSYAQVQSPSLRQLANHDVNKIASALVWATGNAIESFMDNPRALQVAESVNFAVAATGGAAAGNYGLLWLGDGPVKPTSGKIFTVRATGAASLTAGTWVNTAVTFNTVLPAGTYQVVGFRAQGTNLVAARIVFVGAAFRPGVPAEPNGQVENFAFTRDGALGVLGQFDVDQPPTIDCLGATDASQVFSFDLIQTG